MIELKMGLFIRSFALFIGGYAVAFYQGWLLTLIMISSIPPLLIASVVMFRIQNKFSLHEQAAYGEAANIVEQTISSIRTVYIIYIYLYIKTSIKCVQIWCAHLILTVQEFHIS